MDEKAIKYLTSEFPQSQLKTRAGAKGKELTYVEGALVIERLNNAFGHLWSWEILSAAVEPSGEYLDVQVRGRLTVRDGDHVVVKDSFGGVRAKAASMDCRADMLKAASTDALKKAASLLGVALHLYSDEVGAEAAPATTTASSAKAQAGAKGQSQASKGGAAASTSKKPSPLSGRQSAQITTLLRETGMPEEVLAEKVKSKFNCRVEQLTTEDAAKVITFLEGIRDRDGGASPAAPKPSTESKPATKGATLTEKQLKAIMAIGRTLGWTSEALRQRSIDVYGVPVDGLSRQDASAFIGEFQQIATKSAAGA